MTDYGFHKLSNRHDEFATKLTANFHHFVGIARIIEKYRGQTYGCGSYLSYNNPSAADGHGLDYITDYMSEEFYRKQVRLYELAKGIQSVLEVGVNTGHSIFIMLLANPSIQVVGIDLAELPYVEECVEYLNEQFGKNCVRLIKGDSVETLKTVRNFKQSFDLVHIDASHHYEPVKAEIISSYMLGKSRGLFVFDDYGDGVKRAVDEFVALDYFEPVEVVEHHASVFRKTA